MRGWGWTLWSQFERHQKKASYYLLIRVLCLRPSHWEPAPAQRQLQAQGDSSHSWRQMSLPEIRQQGTAFVCFIWLKIQLKVLVGAKKCFPYYRYIFGRRKKNSVSDPNPDPPDPHVFGPSGSGSTCQRYEIGSGSFYYQAKLVKTSFGLFIFEKLCKCTFKK